MTSDISSDNKYLSDFVALYYLNLKTGVFKVNQFYNLRADVKSAVMAFTDYPSAITDYIDRFVPDEDKAWMIEQTALSNVRQQMQSHTNFYIEYVVKANTAGQVHFEVHYIRAGDLADSDDVILGFKCVDSKFRLQEENEHQRQELINARIDNDYKALLLKSMATSYYSMHVIYLKTDRYDVIQDNGKPSPMMQNLPCARKTLTEMTQMMASPVSREEMERFFDLSTLSARLTGVQSIAHEFYGISDQWFRGTFVPVNWEMDGTLISVIYVTRLIDEEKRRELDFQEKLREAYETTDLIFRESLKMSPMGVIVVRERDHRLLAISDVMLEFLDADEAQREVDTYDDLVDQSLSNCDDIKKFLENRFQNAEETTEEEIEFFTQKGTHRIMRNQTRRLMLKSGDVVILNTLSDITDQKAYEEQLLTQSHMDGLTGLYNRIHGEYLIDHYLEDHHPGMFCIFDIDKFKNINDTYGHVVGDSALVFVSACMRDVFDSQDVIMRLGGDEFAVFAPDIRSQDEGQQKLKQLVERITAGDATIYKYPTIQVSCGALFYDGRNINSFDAIYRDADRLMYQCKKMANVSYLF